MTKPSSHVVFKVTLLILLTVAITPVLNFKPASISHQHQASPEIFLAAYSEADSYRGVPPDDGFRLQNQFKNEFISKNGSDYIVYEDVLSVVFTCEAEYPITWAFPYHEQIENLEYYNYDLKEYRSSIFPPELTTPSNLNFKIVLSLRSSYHRGFNFLSLNVTCTSSSTQNHIQSSSIHVFQIGQQSLENEGETLEVYLEPSPHPAPGIAPPRQDRYLGPPLVLPCRPASPEIKLLLEKQLVTKIIPTGNKVFWKPLKNPPSQNYITFDPKIGFTVGRGLFYGNKIYGMYRCSVLISDDDKVDGSPSESVDSNQYVLLNVTNILNNSDGGTEDMLPSFEPKSIIRGAASFHLEWGFETEASVLCCSGIPDKPPKLYPFYCSNDLNCQFLKNQIPEDVAEQELEAKDKAKSIISRNDGYNDSSDCSRSYLYGEKMFVVCHGPNIDYAEEFTNLFSSEAQGPIGNRSLRVRDEEEKDGEYSFHGNSSDRKFTSLTHYAASSSYETHTDGLTPSQKMFLTIGKYARPKEIAIWRKSSLIGLALLFRIHHPKAKKKEASTVDSADDFEDLDIFEDTDDFYLSSFKSIERQSLQIMEYDRDVYYTGEPLNFMCFGLNFYYATPSKNEGGGAHLRLNWENGTRQILDTDLQQSRSKKIKKLRRMVYRMVYLSGGADIASGQAHQINSLFSTVVRAQKGMDSVDCWMAQRNLSGWDTVSRKITVEDSVAPKFLEGEAEETLYFYLGEVGHAFSCVVIGAKPFPSYLKVTKDGKPLKLNFNTDDATHKAKNHNSSNSSHDDPAESGTGTKETEEDDKNKDRVTITIKFGVIKHDMQGIYQCTAKNVNGTAIRTINVFVLQKRGVALPVSLGIAGVLCLVFGGLAIKHWRDKKTVHSLRNNHL